MNSRRPVKSNGSVAHQVESMAEDYELEKWIWTEADFVALSKLDLLQNLQQWTLISPISLAHYSAE
jgi:hypothetical protein